jgi:hypothetical protein
MKNVKARGARQLYFRWSHRDRQFSQAFVLPNTRRSYSPSSYLQFSNINNTYAYNHKVSFCVISSSLYTRYVYRSSFSLAMQNRIRVSNREDKRCDGIGQQEKGSLLASRHVQTITTCGMVTFARPKTLWLLGCPAELILPSTVTS